MVIIMIALFHFLEGEIVLLLHLIVKELELNPITYTYDWGMTSDIGRKNISLMCSKLGIENIIVAADIKKKGKY